MEVMVGSAPGSQRRHVARVARTMRVMAAGRRPGQWERVGMLPVGKAMRSMVTQARRSSGMTAMPR